MEKIHKIRHWPSGEISIIPKNHTCQDTSICMLDGVRHFCGKCGTFWQPTKLYEDIVKYWSKFDKIIEYDIWNDVKRTWQTEVARVAPSGYVVWGLRKR